MSIKNEIRKNIKNIPGWRTNRKIVVIESDDWGAIRMPSNEVRNALIKEGYQLDKLVYKSFDTLESEQDLNLLFNVLSKYKDKNGNPPIITANSVVANPDFDKIRNAEFSEYFYETSLDTYKHYKGRENIFKIIEKGISEKFFMPQSHGREHFNITRWLELLRSGNRDITTAFKYGMCGMCPKDNPMVGNELVMGLEYSNDTEKEFVLKSITEGLDLFEDIYKFPSQTFIAPCYIWSDEIESVLGLKDIKLIQTIGYRTSACPNEKGKRIWLGQKNNFGARYLVRNCSFEPSLLKYQPLLENRDVAISNCLREIEIAFMWHKPAIISSHRINFAGSLVSANRDINLKLLSTLLDKITTKWPDVEFMSSDKLIELIN